MAAQLKAALDLAVTDFKQSCILIKRCLETDPINERSLKIKSNALADSLAKLNSAHTMWMKKAAPTEDQLAAEEYSVTGWKISGLYLMTIR